MDFDPLSLFTPKPPIRQLPSPHLPPKSSPTSITPSPSLDPFSLDPQSPLHPLDLPQLALKPPPEILIVVLKLVATNQIWNFSSIPEPTDAKSVLANKSIDLNLIDNALNWATLYCPRFDSLHKLSLVPNAAASLLAAKEYNHWLTNIIANDLSWIDGPNREIIYKQSSLRMAENCGRMAQPELIRNIKLEGMETWSIPYIKLKEPSLTNDNLGLKTWGSSLVLGQRLLKSQNLLHLELPILELGAGTGLVGILLCLLGYNDVFLTDLSPILPNLLDNLELNNVTTKVDLLDWSDHASFLNKYGPIKFNTIILSDPIYSEHHPQWVFNTLTQFLAPKGHVILQVPLRKTFHQERDHLWSLLNSKFTKIYHDNEVGSDDFGNMDYSFSIYHNV